MGLFVLFLATIASTSRLLSVLRKTLKLSIHFKFSYLCAFVISEDTHNKMIRNIKSRKFKVHRQVTGLQNLYMGQLLQDDVDLI